MLKNGLLFESGNCVLCIVFFVLYVGCLMLKVGGVGIWMFDVELRHAVCFWLVVLMFSILCCSLVDVC